MKPHVLVPFFLKIKWGNLLSCLKFHDDCKFGGVDQHGRVVGKRVVDTPMGEQELI